MKKKTEKKAKKASEESDLIEISSDCRIMPSLEDYQALPKFGGRDKPLTDVEQLQLQFVELREMIEDLALRIQELEWALVPEKRVISSADFFWDPEIFGRAKVTEKQIAKHLASLLTKASAKTSAAKAKSKEAPAKKPAAKPKKAPAKKPAAKPKKAPTKKSTAKRPASKSKAKK